MAGHRLRVAPGAGGIEAPARHTDAVSTARELALHCLQRIDHDGAYANLVVPAALSGSTLDQRDRGFVTELVYGTTRMRRACDALVDRFVLAEPEPAVRTLLRLGAYQLHFAGVRPHAAVAETVALAPKRLRAFANAILRNVSRTAMVWPDRATELSYPQWMFDLLTEELGDDALPVMQRMNEPPPVSVRDDGYVQDRASQWVAASVGAAPGERVLDMCAAPGGKATAMAAREGADGAFVVAADVAAQRVHLIGSNVARLSAAVAPVVADGTSSPFVAGSFDRVLLDAPCSGLGALRRRPDARWRITAPDIDDLVLLQGALLNQAATLVRPGGALVYSVCTLTAAESIDHTVPDGFDVDTAEPTGAWEPFAHGWRVLPYHHDTDGMVLIRYRRRS